MKYKRQLMTFFALSMLAGGQYALAEENIPNSKVGIYQSQVHMRSFGEGREGVSEKENKQKSKKIKKPGRSAKSFYSK